MQFEINEKKLENPSDVCPACGCDFLHWEQYFKRNNYRTDYIEELRCDECGNLVFGKIKRV